MTTTYTNGSVSITRDMIFGWLVLTVDDYNHKKWTSFKDLDKSTLENIIRNLRDPIFPVEAAREAQIALDQHRSVETEVIKVFKLTVVHSEENWRLISNAVETWGVENAKTHTMVAIFYNEKDYEAAKEQLKTSSLAYPDQL